MKIKINEFRKSGAEPVDVPVDFSELRALLNAHQSASPTAQLANAPIVDEMPDAANPAVAVLRTEPGWETAATATRGSFHAAAAARFNPKSA